MHIRKTLELIEDTHSNFKPKTREQIIQRRSTMRSTKMNINAPSSVSLFKSLGFVYKGYKPDHYYWEIVLFSRKFVLIMIGVVQEIFPKETQNSNLILFLFFYYYIQMSYQPYAFDYLNRIESTTLKISLITALIAILFFNNFFQRASIYFLVFILLINVYFLGLWIYYVGKYGNFKKKWEKFLKKIHNISNF